MTPARIGVELWAMGLLTGMVFGYELRVWGPTWARLVRAWVRRTFVDDEEGT
tara:strand:- start:629 stop:784 length:156 start_codon:yes stop_codon:yes gene_type:complete